MISINNQLRKLFCIISIVVFIAISQAHADITLVGLQEEKVGPSGSLGPTLTEKVDGNVNGAGTLTFESSGTTISEAIGSNFRLATVNIYDFSNVTANATINANNINIGNNTTSSLTLNAAATAINTVIGFNSLLSIGENGSIAGPVDGSVDGVGTVEFDHRTGALSNNMGLNNRLREIRLVNGSNITTTHAIRTGYINIEDGSSLTSSALTDVLGNFNNDTIYVNIENGSQLITNGAFNVVGNINIENGSQLTANAALNVSDNIDIKDNSSLTAKHTISAKNIKIGSGSTLYGVDLLSNSNSTLNAFVDGASNGLGTLSIDDSPVVLVSKAIGSNNRLFEIDIINDSGIYANAAINASNINIENNSVLVTVSSVNADQIDIEGTSALQLDTNGSLNAKVDGDSAGEGFLYFSANNSTISQAIGSSKKLAEINLQSTSNITANADMNANIFNMVAGSDLTTNAAVNAATINVGSNSVLTLGDNGSIEGDVVLDGTGTLILGRVSKTIVGNIAGSGFGAIDLGSGSHSITGNLTTFSGDTVKLNLGSAPLAGSATVTGAANIDSGAKLNIAKAGVNYVFVPGGTKTAIISAGSGSINKIEDGDINYGSGSNATDFLSFTTSVEDSGKKLMLNINRPSATSLTNNIVTQNVYNNIISQVGVLATDELKNFQQYLDEDDDSIAQKVAAIKTLAPQSDNNANAVVLNTTNTSVKITGDRLISLYRGKILGKAAGDNTNNTGIWGQVFGSNATQKDSGVGDGYNSKSQGFVMGGDKGIGKSGHLGMSVSYAQSSIKSEDQLRNIDVDTYQLNVYGGNGFGKFFVNGVVGLSLNDYSSSRIIPIQSLTANGSYKGQTYTTKVEGGMMQNLRYGFNIVPTLAATFAYNKTDDYTETGAGALSLHRSESPTEFFEGRAGVLLGYNTIVRDFRVNPNIRASYGYDIIGDDQSSTNNFVGQTASFQAKATNVDQGSLQLGVGLNIYTDDLVTIGLDYILESKSRYTSNSASARVRYNF
ncbi:MAG: hypothetical protein K0R25_845 [Rickettsiaceae bacterium]|jgi:outer membrane autotransporter protein|nr:hypothetical protein [Rickettsiaceae bacterium]